MMMLMIAAAPNFNPRTREGCDVPFGRMPASPSEFQSTHP